jgi:uncharacterized protein
MNALQTAQALKSVAAKQWRMRSPLVRRAPANFAGQYGPRALVAGASEASAAPGRIMRHFAERNAL